MPSYVITGASRGIGWGFIQHLSSDPSNTVIGLVRNAAPTISRVQTELPDRKNITILQADLNDTPAIQKAAADTAALTNGTLDYLIGNAAYLDTIDQFDGPRDLLANLPRDVFLKQWHTFMDTNALAQVFLYEAFLPLLLKGDKKKVLSVSSGMGDLHFNRDEEHAHALFYAVSKAALNMVNVKFGAEYAKDGVLFVSMCPGLVDTGGFANLTPEESAKFAPIMKKFAAYAPDFKGPYEATDSVKHMLDTLDTLSVEKGDAGKYISHFGSTTRWLP